MITSKRIIATVELLLVFPAALFMSSLFLRSAQPPQYQPAKAAARIVEWFAARPLLGLDIFLIALPLTVFIVGCVIILRSWRRDMELRQASLQMFDCVRAHLATLIIAGATLVAGGILAVVAVHVITD